MNTHPHAQVRHCVTTVTNNTAHCVHQRMGQLIPGQLPFTVMLGNMLSVLDINLCGLLTECGFYLLFPSLHPSVLHAHLSAPLSLFVGQSVSYLASFNLSSSPPPPPHPLALVYDITSCGRSPDHRPPGCQGDNVNLAERR